MEEGGQHQAIILLSLHLSIFNYLRIYTFFNRNHILTKAGEGKQSRDRGIVKSPPINSRHVPDGAGESADVGAGVDAAANDAAAKRPAAACLSATDRLARRADRLRCPRPPLPVPGRTCPFDKQHPPDAHAHSQYILYTTTFESPLNAPFASIFSKNIFKWTHFVLWINS